MINRFFGYRNPVCDFCGAMLGAEKSDEAAEEAMRREGWEKRSGKDACALCVRIEKETGKIPERRQMWEFSNLRRSGE